MLELRQVFTFQLLIEVTALANDFLLLPAVASRADGRH
jgi:hypothetical protein